MNTFPQVQADVFANVAAQFGAAIDLTANSNSNIYYSNEAQNAFLVEQAIGSFQNNFSIYSAQGNNLNSLGGILNYHYRPYYTVSLNCALVGSNAATITAGLEVTYTDANSVIYYFQCDNAITLDSSGNASETFYLVGTNPANVSALPTFPSGALSIVASSATITGTLTSVSNTTSYIPSPLTDADYAILLQDIYQSSSFGLDGAINLVLQNLDFIVSSKVYVGTNPVGTTTITGKTNNYILSYGVFLIVVYFSAPVTGGMSYIPYKYQVTANSIFSRFNFLNQTYAPATPLANEVTVPVTSALGNVIDINFYNAEETVLTIVITASSTLVVLNNDQKAAFFQDIASYINGTGIGATIYFANIAEIAFNYGLTLINLSINGTPNLFELTAAADEKFLTDPTTNITISYA